ncbi:hypothetical protein FFLO_04014 [Filobasidium floriforme]|uniref:Uncharacterized protein n=1 Tax=Filobasidium floriforme TaxID=5210 RepID=A0A8K0JJN9_9TREE|nr:hypothetical protein FFLO_04014 [Filobasidium floriforme]
MGGPAANAAPAGSSACASNQAQAKSPALSQTEEPDEAQMQALLDKLLSGNMDNLDLGSFGVPPADTTSKSASTSKVGSNGGSSRPKATAAANSQQATSPGTNKDQGLSFEETIERTMKNLKEGADDAKKSKPAAQDPLMALLAQLTSDPDALGDLDLDGLDLSALSASLGLDGKAGGALGEGGDEGMGGVLDGMMRGLMTKEILMEPLEELAEKYPPYLNAQRSNPTIPPTQLSNYETQSQIISQILELFRRPGYSDDDEEKRKEVYDLMCRMQEMGSPPEEVMGEMPEGLGFGDEACTIM